MNLAIIGAGHMARAYAQKAKEKNLIVHLFAWEEGAVAKEYADFFYPISVLDKESILEICKNLSIDGVIASTSLAITTASYIAQKLGLNSNALDVAIKVQNKNWVREKLIDAKNIRQPYFALYTSREDVCSKDLNFPVIAKPVAGGGKQGVMVAHNEEELEQALRYAFLADKNKKGILVEEFLAYGKEYSVESISFKGEHQVIQVTEKISSGPPHCVELGHNQPADISDKVYGKIFSAINEVLNEVGWENGPTHTEIKIVNGEIYLIELNARAAGDHIASTLVMLSTEYDYLGEVINGSLNIKPRKFDNKRDKKYVGIIFIAEQTKHLLEFFNRCDGKRWLYEKHVNNDEIFEMKGNDGFRINYFIYCDKEKPEWVI